MGLFYLEVLVVDAESFSQVAENKRAILLKFKVAGHVLPKKKPPENIEKSHKHHMMKMMMMMISSLVK